ncbi:MAG: hypothetical protein ACRCSN_13170 [Dermatophilaceae bacterium]
MASTYGQARRIVESKPVAVVGTGDSVADSTSSVVTADGARLTEEKGRGADALRERSGAVTTEADGAAADSTAGADAIRWYGTQLDDARYQAYGGAVTYEAGTQWRESLNAWAEANPSVTLAAAAQYRSAQIAAGDIQHDGLRCMGDIVRCNQADAVLLDGALRSGDTTVLAQNSTPATTSQVEITVTDKDLTPRLDKVMMNAQTLLEASRRNRSGELGMEEQSNNYALAQNGIYLADFLDLAQDRGLELDRSGLRLTNEIAARGRAETDAIWNSFGDVDYARADVGRRRAQFIQDQDGLNLLRRTDAALQAGFANELESDRVAKQIRFEKGRLRKDEARYQEYLANADLLARQSPEGKLVWQDIQRLEADAVLHHPGKDGQMVAPLGLNNLVETIEQRYPFLDDDHDRDMSPREQQIIAEQFGLPPAPADLDGAISEQERKVENDRRALDHSLQVLDDVTVPEYTNPLQEFQQENEPKKPYPTLTQMDFDEVDRRNTWDTWLNRTAGGFQLTKDVADELIRPRDPRPDANAPASPGLDDAARTNVPGYGEPSTGQPDADDQGNPFIDIQIGDTYEVGPWESETPPWERNGEEPAGPGGDDAARPGDGIGDAANPNRVPQTKGHPITLYDWYKGVGSNAFGVNQIAANAHLSAELDNLRNHIIPETVANQQAFANNARQSYDFGVSAQQAAAEQADLSNENTRDNARAGTDRGSQIEVRNTMDAIRLTEERADGAAMVDQYVIDYETRALQHGDQRALEEFRIDSTENYRAGVLNSLTTNADAVLTEDQEKVVRRIVDRTSDMGLDGQLRVIRDSVGELVWDSLVTGRSSY